MATVFFSYSHVDEGLRDRLEIALSALKRQGLIEAWHDRRLIAGDDFDRGVRGELERADVILLLVSPDFIASDYCYGVEMTRALERHERGEARVIPVILRACDWHPLPFGKLLAAPRDGKPVRSWPDLDEAFLDVAQKIRAALPKAEAARATAPSAAQPVPMAPQGARSSNLRLRKSFTEVDHDRFLDDSFEFLARFFENSLQELKARNEGIDTTFRRIDGNRFTAAVYRDGTAVSRGSIVRGGMFGRGISWSANDEAASNSCNEYLLVENDEQGLFLRAGGMPHIGRGNPEGKLTQEGAGEYLWELLMQPLQWR
ncbi:toll/interleukin-1 receptor domain-containing protein [Methylorubrum populi]